MQIVLARRSGGRDTFPASAGTNALDAIKMK